MTAAIFDFSDIKRRALFPANRPQDAGTPVIAPVPDYGMYAGFDPSASLDSVMTVIPPDSYAAEYVAAHKAFFGGLVAPAPADTAPCEYLAQDFDPA